MPGATGTARPRRHEGTGRQSDTTTILARVTRAHIVALEAPDDVLEAAPAAPVPLPALDLPRARRPGWPTLAALAAGCGVAAVALGTWALVAGTRSEAAPEPTASPSLAVLADPTAERYPLRGSVGRIALVVNHANEAVLVLAGLGAAPDGMAYQAWVVPPGSAHPLSAGAFDASERVVPLSAAVPRGARVGVTLEQVGGADRPSRALRLVAVRD